MMGIGEEFVVGNCWIWWSGFGVKFRVELV